MATAQQSTAPATPTTTVPIADAPDARSAARWTAVAFVFVGIVTVVIVDLSNETRKAWELAADKKEEFELFAAYFIAAAGIERLIEVVSGWFPFVRETEPTEEKARAVFRAQRKADRGVLTAACAAMVGMVASAVTGLYFLRAVGASPPLWADMALTGLLLSGGTKTIHELLRTIQKARTGTSESTPAAPAAPTTPTPTPTPSAGAATPTPGGAPPAQPAAGGTPPPPG